MVLFHQFAFLQFAFYSDDLAKLIFRIQRAGVYAKERPAEALHAMNAFLKGEKP